MYRVTNFKYTIMINNILKYSIFPLLFIGSISITSCSDDDEDNTPLLPMIEVLQSESTPIAVTCDNVLQSGGYKYDFTIKLDKESSTTLMCDISTNTDLVDAYNAKHNTNYKPMPASVYMLNSSNAIIKSGELESNALSISFKSLFGLTSGDEYLLPINVTVDESCANEFSQNEKSVGYFLLNVDRELNYIPGLRLGSSYSSMNAELSFPNSEIVTVDGNTHTFEMLIYPYSWHSGTNYIGTWRGKDTNNGNEVFSGCEYRTTTGGVSTIGNRQCDLTTSTSGVSLPTNQWVLVTVTCDGTKTGQNSEVAYRLYIDGELKASKAPTKRYGTSSSQRFQVGYTLTGIQFGNSTSSYYFDGLISEIRMWKKCLTETEVKANLRKVQSPTSTDMYGYWKLNEGTGNLLKDSSGNGRNLSYPTSTSVVWSAELDNSSQK